MSKRKSAKSSDQSEVAQLISAYKRSLRDSQRMISQFENKLAAKSTASTAFKDLMNDLGSSLPKRSVNPREKQEEQTEDLENTNVELAQDSPLTSENTDEQIAEIEAEPTAIGDYYDLSREAPEQLVDLVARLTEGTDEIVEDDEAVVAPDGTDEFMQKMDALMKQRKAKNAKDKADRVLKAFDYESELIRENLKIIEESEADESVRLAKTHCSVIPNRTDVEDFADSIMSLVKRTFGETTKIDDEFDRKMEVLKTVAFEELCQNES